ncbi:MAG: CoA:oxalate CoA-transferase [Chloroflexi bacterium]|nr:MAG: CoA:oxalate CoA-transferase [Chloroflexota bacterium]
MAIEPHGPLSGVRVVEFAVAVQGPLAGGFLADMGADVIKVEPPGGDGNRWHTGVNWPLPKETPGAQFLSVSHGKRSISVDIHSDVGREVMHRLIDRTDIFLSNFREPSLERMGMGYEALSARNPRLVYAIANGFGHRGPDRDKRMTDQFAQSRSGISSVTGDPGSATVIPGAVIGDTGGAMGLALGIMTALAARELHGIGQKVQTSSYGIMVWMQAWEINHSSVTGTTLRRDGPHHPNVPGIVGLYDTADGGAFCVGINSGESWREFCDFGGIPEVGADPQWDSYDKRSPTTNFAHAETANELRPHVARAMRNRTSAEWEQFFDAHQEDIMYQRVLDYDDVLHDPQALENGYIVEKDVPGVGKRPMVGNPMQFNKTPAVAQPWYSALGQHTAEIMGELGFSADEIATIEAQKSPGQPMSRRGRERAR